MQDVLNRDCECWERTISLTFSTKDFPKDAIRYIYCPRCSPGIRKDDACMVERNGWLIEYDPKRLWPAFSLIRLVRKPEEKMHFLICVGKKKIADMKISRSQIN